MPMGFLIFSIPSERISNFVKEALRERCLFLLSLRIQSECGKIRTGKTPNMEIFYAVRANQGSPPDIYF